MTNLLPTIAPKSDQLNADDLIGRTLTIKVARVSLCGEPDQPIAVHYEGDEGKPYKPCKSMRRVLVHVWGSDGNVFVGRRMTLYRDDKVQFGGMAVGGIRISHMSDIDRDVTLALTATRAHRKPYTVRAIGPDRDNRGAGERGQSIELVSLLAGGDDAAKRGSMALTTWWKGLSPAEKAAAKPTLDDRLKAAAARADQAALEDDHPAAGEDTPSDNGPTDDAGAGLADSDEGQSGDFDPLTWASEENRRLETFANLADLDAHTSNPLTFKQFTALQDHSPGMAKALDAAVRGRRKALKDRESAA